MSRIAFITNGHEELGQAVCLRLARLGYGIVATCPAHDPRTEKLRAAVESLGSMLRAYSVDATRSESVRECWLRTEWEVGPVDILVNSVLLDGENMRPQEWLAGKAEDTEDALFGMKGRFASLVSMSELAFERLTGQGWGRIVTLLSVRSPPTPWAHADPASAMQALRILTSSLSLRSEGTGLTVNLVYAGGIGSGPFTAGDGMAFGADATGSDMSARLSIAQEAAGLVAYLVSEEAGFISGADISLAA